MQQRPNNDAVVAKLAHEHLGPVPELPIAVAEHVQTIMRGMGDDLGMRRCLAAVHAAGITCSARQMKPFRDAEIWRRMGKEARQAAQNRGMIILHADPATAI